MSESPTNDRVVMTDLGCSLECPNACAYKACRRLDEVEEQAKALWVMYEELAHTKRRRIQHARILAAIHGGELITRRDMQRRKGVNQSTVQAWTRLPDFPAMARVGSGRRPDRWEARAFEEWYAHHVLKPKVRAQAIIREAAAELRESRSIAE